MKKTNNGTATAISSFLIFLLVVLVIGFFAFRTDNFTTGMKDFYVSQGGKNIISDEDNFEIVIGKEYKFEIHNEFEKISNTDSNYYVQVAPNDKNDFNFYIDNIKKSFIEIESLSKFFIINSYDNYFTFKATNIELFDMLVSIYETENIVDCPTLINSGFDYLRLIVSSSDNEIININFNIRSE